VSLINGCAFCIDMHTKDLRAAGEKEERVALVPVWRETDLFSPRERAALALAEAMTRLADGQVADAIYEAAEKELGPKALVELALAVTTINAWNRMGITFQSKAGVYHPKPQ
jgi:AhpD family alkylhydroperoxidase